MIINRFKIKIFLENIFIFIIFQFFSIFLDDYNKELSFKKFIIN
jgi:hypothetical protein